MIKLYPAGMPANSVPTDTETPVVSESYDEVVFTDPTEAFFSQLLKVGQLPPLQYSQQEHFQTFSDGPDSLALLEAQKFLQKELATAKDRWLSVDEIAAYLGVKRDTIYKWIDRKQMPAHKAGRLWKFRKDEVDLWVRAGVPQENTEKGR